MACNRKLSEEIKTVMFELDAEGPSDVGWVDIENFGKFGAMVMRSVGTTGLDDFRILGNTTATGSGTDIVLATGTILSTVDAVGDTAWLEIGQEVLDANPTVRGVSVSLGHVTATDESVITYIFGDPRQVSGALTAGVIA